jgi:uncharacterized membrane protein YsdA (DUF1294 family)/cold shock CspA family protein
MDRGIVVAYDAAKGFGFIRANGYRGDVFVHASSIEGGASLKPGQRVAFEAEQAEKGPRTTRVEPGKNGLTPGMAAAVGLGVGLAAVTGLMHRAGLGWLGAWLAGVNVATWPVYAWDKHRAVMGGRRVPEAVLLGLALAGGSPAAALAMWTLHHKTSKPSFLFGFAAVVIVQVVAVGYWLSRRV